MLIIRSTETGLTPEINSMNLFAMLEVRSGRFCLLTWVLYRAAGGMSSFLLNFDRPNWELFGLSLGILAACAAAVLARWPSSPPVGRRVFDLCLAFNPADWCVEYLYYLNYSVCGDIYVGFCYFDSVPFWTL
jgi:hypothetical protein